MNNSRDHLRDKIYLAALLHDIGKFFQRTDNGSIITSGILSDLLKTLEPVFCPINPVDKSRSQKHVLWTARFIEEFRGVFQKLPEIAEWQNLEDKDSLLYLAAGHHLSQELLSEAGKIIRHADRSFTG